MRFSLKSLFCFVTMACVYMAALGIVIDAMVSAEAGTKVSLSQLVMIFVSLCVLFCGTGAAIGMLWGDAERGLTFGAIVGIVLLFVSMFLSSSI